MENQEIKLDSSKILALVLIFIALAAEIVFNAISLTAGNAPVVIKSVLSLIAMAGAVYYITSGYKKPHGNSMKYLMLIFAFTLALSFAFADTIAKNSFFALTAVVLIAYMAGRLNKEKKNRVLSVIILGLLLLYALFGITSVAENAQRVKFAVIISSFAPFVTWAALAFSYLLRFRSHKEAGETY